MAGAANEIIQATDSTLDKLLASPKPTLLLLWNGDSLRSDLRTEIDKLTTEFGGRLQVIKINTVENPKAASRFEVSQQPLLVGLYCGETIARRSRPWGTDARGLADQLVALTPPEPVLSKPGENGNGAGQNGKNNLPIHVTDATFESVVIRSPLPAIVDFWASWCGPCKMVAPILDKLAGEFAGKVLIAKVDVDANQGLSQAFGIQSIPTLMLVKNQKIVGQVVGAQPEVKLRDLIQKLLAFKVPA